MGFFIILAEPLTYKYLFKLHFGASTTGCPPVLEILEFYLSLILSWNMPILAIYPHFQPLKNAKKQNFPFGTAPTMGVGGSLR